MLAITFRVPLYKNDWNNFAPSFSNYTWGKNLTDFEGTVSGVQ